MAEVPGIKASRDNHIEFAKLVAIIAIFFHHALSSEVLFPFVRFNNFAVPAFAGISCYYAIVQANRSGSPILALVKKRFIALAYIFSVWNFLAILFVITRNCLMGNSILSSINLDSVFLGANPTLWFLPFILFFNLLAVFLARLSKSDFLRLSLGASFLVLGFGLAASKKFIDFDPNQLIYFLDVSRKGIPAALIGISVGLFSVADTRNWFKLLEENRLMLGLGLSVLFLGTYGIFRFDRSLYLWETLMGLGFVCVFVGLRNLHFPTIDSRLCLWIYLSHIPVLQVVSVFLSATGLGSVQNTSLDLFLALLLLGVIIVVFFILNSLMLFRCFFESPHTFNKRCFANG